MPHFPETHLVEACQHLVILYFGRALGPISVMRRPEVSLDPRDSSQQLSKPSFQLHSYRIVVRHVGGSFGLFRIV
jgi:hypothetical protein